MLHKVSIAGLTIDPATNTPIVILKSTDDDRAVPIWIGLLEASSIASVIQGVQLERPMTHDLFKNFVERMNMRIVKVEVCDLKDNTFYAKIHFASGDETFEMDARPSDAIAMALRFNAPIYVEESVIENAAVIEGRPELIDESEEGKKWAEYLDRLSPDDFGKV